MLTRFLPWTLVAGWLVANTYGAMLIPVSQERFVHASASAGLMGGPYVTDEETITAPDFGLFSATVSVDAYSDWTGSHAEAQASQTSLIHADGLSGQGATSMSASGFMDAAASSYARSRLAVSFRVPHSASFTLSGTLAIEEGLGEGGLQWARCVLAGPQGALYELQPYPGDPVAYVNAQGQLMPGTLYTLELIAYCSGWGDPFINGAASWDIALDLIPEPATLYLLVCVAVVARRRH